MPNLHQTKPAPSKQMSRLYRYISTRGGAVRSPLSDRLLTISTQQYSHLNLTIKCSACGERILENITKPLNFITVDITLASQRLQVYMSRKVPYSSWNPQSCSSLIN